MLNISSCSAITGERKYEGQHKTPLFSPFKGEVKILSPASFKCDLRNVWKGERKRIRIKEAVVGTDLVTGNMQDNSASSPTVHVYG